MPVSKTLIDEQILKNIARTIREGTNLTEKIVPSDFCNHIKQFITTITNLEKEKEQLLQEKKLLEEKVASLEDKEIIATCTLKLSADLNTYLHGYGATTYNNGKFYCNYILPQTKECYKNLTIENVVCGSILILYVDAAKNNISFEGISCLDSSKDFTTYFFKVPNKDTEINIYH